MTGSAFGGVRFPIIQAPMAGGADSPALAAAVCEAGGIGWLGVAYLQPAAIAEAAGVLAGRVYGLNLFLPQPVSRPTDDEIAAAIEVLAPYHAELGLAAPVMPAVPVPDFSQQLDAVLATDAAMVSFTFGCPSPDVIEAVRARGKLPIGTATTVEEARVLAAAGCEAIVAQGAEAGGHRGSFWGDTDGELIGTIALVPQVVDAVRVPVIAAGGIADGRGIAAALALGASAVQIGTAFLTCDEAGTAATYRAALAGAAVHDTRITRAFSGRPARGIANAFAALAPRLPFPWQNALTAPLRRAAAAAGRSDLLSLWAGQGVALAGRGPAGAFLTRLADEARAAGAAIAAPRMVVDDAFAHAFAVEWCDAWNSGVLERVMAHYTDDFEMASPIIAQRGIDPGGVLKGKAAVGAYWGAALATANPPIRFELIAAYAGARSVSIHYRSVGRKYVVETLTFDDDRRAIKGSACYGAPDA